MRIWDGYDLIQMLWQQCNNKILLQKKRDDSDEEDDEDTVYLKRLDVGLFSLQLIDYIILEICSSGQATIKQRALQMLNLRGGSTKTLKQIMRGNLFSCTTLQFCYSFLTRKVVRASWLALITYLEIHAYWHLLMLLEWQLIAAKSNSCDSPTHKGIFSCHSKGPKFVRLRR